jgi:endonuclease/exonuclease/phosphatase family metal-dependent hydrolase
MSRREALVLGVALPLLSGASACVSNHRVAIDLPQTCRARFDDASVRWEFAGNPNERRDSDRWCAGVGVPTISAGASIDEVAEPALIVVTWNTHVGAGNLTQFIGDLQSGRFTDGRRVDDFVLLLQEVYRRGDKIPVPLPEGAKAARAAHHGSPDRPAGEIGAAAAALGLALFYAPSMRNGANIPEDRGNAILSTLPLDDYAGIELPLERQRRVAVAATVNAKVDETPVRLRVVSAHLSNFVGHHLWIFSGWGRARQARALAAVLTERPIVMGGDFNTWFGSWDAAYRELARVLESPPGDHRSTFWLLRLDHFFVCLPHGWQVTVRRADNRYGSDHYPVIARIVVPRV